MRHWVVGAYRCTYDNPHDVELNRQPNLEPHLEPNQSPNGHPFANIAPIDGAIGPPHVNLSHGDAGQHHAEY